MLKKFILIVTILTCFFINNSAHAQNCREFILGAFRTATEKNTTGHVRSVYTNIISNQFNGNSIRANGQVRPIAPQTGVDLSNPRLSLQAIREATTHFTGRIDATYIGAFTSIGTVPLPNIPVNVSIYEDSTVILQFDDNNYASFKGRCENGVIHGFGKLIKVEASSSSLPLIHFAQSDFASYVISFVFIDYTP